MNFTELIYQQSKTIKKLLRKIENLEKKLAMHELLYIYTTYVLFIACGSL